MPGCAADPWEPWLGAVVGPVELAAAASGPLSGLRTGVKDILSIAGHPRRCGADELTDPGPQPRTATAVARLAAAGARVVARLATHQYAFGVVTPGTRNPRVPDRIAGGSSGGSAAAVAAGLVDVALGTDTGGSVRIPAACCGVAGLKTTRGLVPLTGVHPLAWSLDTVGPLAGDVTGLKRLVPVLAGFDEADPYSCPDARLAPAAQAPLRIGVPHQIHSARMDADVRDVWQATLDGLAASGAATVTAVDVPLLDVARLANGRILAAEAAAVHARALRERPDAFLPDVRVRLEAGRDAAAAQIAAERHLGARFRASLRALFASVDVLVIPTLPCRVPAVGVDPLDVGGATETRVSAMTRFTCPWNLAGVPAGSVPAGRDGDGGPVGMQVVAGPFAECTALAAMRMIEDVAGGAWPAAEPPARREQSAGG